MHAPLFPLTLILAASCLWIRHGPHTTFWSWEKHSAAKRSVCMHIHVPFTVYWSLNYAVSDIAVMHFCLPSPPITDYFQSLSWTLQLINMTWFFFYFNFWNYITHCYSKIWFRDTKLNFNTFLCCSGWLAALHSSWSPTSTFGLFLPSSTGGSSGI